MGKKRAARKEAKRRRKAVSSDSDLTFAAPTTCAQPVPAEGLAADSPGYPPTPPQGASGLLDSWLARLDGMTDEEQEARWSEKVQTGLSLPEYVRHQMKGYELRHHEQKLSLVRLTLWAYKLAFGIYVRPEDLDRIRRTTRA